MDCLSIFKKINLKNRSKQESILKAGWPLVSVKLPLFCAASLTRYQLKVVGEGVRKVTKFEHVQKWWLLPLGTLIVDRQKDRNRIRSQLRVSGFTLPCCIPWYKGATGIITIANLHRPRL